MSTLQHYTSNFFLFLYWEPWRTSLIISPPSPFSSSRTEQEAGSAEPIPASRRRSLWRGAALGIARDSTLSRRGESRTDGPAVTSNGGGKSARHSRGMLQSHGEEREFAQGRIGRMSRSHVRARVSFWGPLTRQDIPREGRQMLYL
jgi:hypothetical protein